MASKAAGHVVAVSKKYTVQSHGIWEVIRRALAVSPERSTGVPLNAQFRNPTPGANPPLEYTDPVTMPAGDIAQNPYWQRDGRRKYPQLSTVRQADVVALLSVGSEKMPLKELVGEAGSKELVAAKTVGEEKGLAAFLETRSLDAALPVMPPGMNHGVTREGLGEKTYTLEAEQTYGEDKLDQYPCRTFS